MSSRALPRVSPLVAAAEPSAGGPASLAELCCLQVAREASASHAAAEHWAQRTAELHELHAEQLVRVCCAFLSATTDAQKALRLGRCLPAHRAQLWGCMPPAQALAQTPLWALLQQPCAIAFWVDGLGSSLSTYGGAFGAGTSLQGRLELLYHLCREHAFAPEVRWDMLTMERQLQGLLRFFFPRDTFELRRHGAAELPPALRWPGHIRPNPMWPRFEPPLSVPTPYGLSPQGPSMPGMMGDWDLL